MIRMLLVTTSKALVTTSVALVTSSVALVTSRDALAPTNLRVRSRERIHSTYCRDV